MLSIAEKKNTIDDSKISNLLGQNEIQHEIFFRNSSLIEELQLAMRYACGRMLDSPQWP